MKTPLDELHQVFSALGSSSSLDLLDTISELIQEGLDEQMNIKKECDAKRKQYDQELSELETTFSDNLDTVAELAEDAVRIPHFKDPFWGSKRYEMDASEYKELEEKLMVLSEAAPGILKGNLDAIEQAVSKIQSAEEEAEKCRSKLADLEGLKKRFDQLHKQIDQLSQLHR